MASSDRERIPRASTGTGSELWLFRHGEVAEACQGLAYGGMDVPLSGEGLRETEALAERFRGFPFRAVLASPLVRARTLGERLAAASGAPLVVDPGLVEIDRGRWQGLTVEELMREHEREVQAFYEDPWNWREHGGETDADVVARAWPPIERALGRYGGPLAVACHYNVIRVVVAELLGIPPPASFRLRVDLTAACALRDAPGGWTLVRSNVRGNGLAR